MWVSHCSDFSCCGAQTLGTWAPVVAACGASNCGPTGLIAPWHWDLPESGIECKLTGGFLTTGPPGKS